jgi:hypothetical protein
MNVRDSETHFKKHNSKRGQGERSEKMTRAMQQMRSFRCSARSQLEEEMEKLSQNTRKRKWSDIAARSQAKRRQVTMGRGPSCPVTSTATNPAFTEEAGITTNPTGLRLLFLS